MKTENELYLPSNGTEGMIFTEYWCGRCTKDTMLRGGKTYCSILSRTMTVGNVKQWIYKEGIPTCTSFVKLGSVKKHSNNRLQLELNV